VSISLQGLPRKTTLKVGLPRTCRSVRQFQKARESSVILFSLVLARILAGEVIPG